MAKELGNSNGWVCLHRSFKDWQHYGEPSVMVVFVDLLLSVNAKDGWWHGHKCERGATFRSIRSIAEDTTLNPITIRRAFAKLEETGEIKRIRIDQKHTKTIVCNFAKYQDFGCVSVLKNNTQSNTQSNTKQQDNKENNTTTYNKENAHEEILNWLVNSQYLEQFAMSEGITPEFCRKLAEDIITEWKMVGTTHRNVTDARQHLLNHIRKAVTTMRENGTLIATVEKAKRLQPLIDGCKQLKEMGYPHEDVAEFYRYWIQPTTDGTGRMLFEKQQGWDTKRRFSNYLKRKAQ